MNEMGKKTRKHAVLSHPVLGGILIMLWGWVFYQCLMMFAIPFNNDAAAGFIAAIAGVLLLLIHKFWFRGEYAGSVSLNGFSNKQIIIVVVIYLLIDVVSVVGSAIDDGLGALTVPNLQALSVCCQAAFAEEATFRALGISVMMRSYKDKDSYLPALIIPAIGFGLIHLVNALVGAGLGITILQALGCVATGILFGAIYLRTGNVAITILLHFIHDYACMIIASASSSGVMQTSIGAGVIVSESVIALIQIALAVFILRGHKDEIMETWKNIWA